jgi:hypothetical protein
LALPQVFNSWNTTANGERVELYTNVTLWGMISRMYTSAKEVYQDHASWAANGVNISDHAAAHFYLKNGPDFFTSYRKVA